MNSVGYLFQMTHWQTGLVFGLMIIGMILVGITWKKSNRAYAFVAALILGLTIGGVIGILDSFYPATDEHAIFSLFSEDHTGESGGHANPFPEGSWQLEVFTWLEVVPGIFISAIFFIVPLLVFAQSVTTITRFGNKDYNSKHYFASLVFSMSLAILSLLVAYALIPVWSRINIDYFHQFAAGTETVDPTIPGIVGTWVPSSVSIFTSVVFVVSLSMLGIFIGFIILYLLRTKNKSAKPLNNFFRNTNSLLRVSIEWVGRLLPFVVLTTVPQLFFNNFSVNLTEMLILSAFIIVGILVIYMIQIGIGSLLTRKLRYKPIQFAKANWKVASMGFKAETPDETQLEMSEFVIDQTDEHATHNLVRLNTEKMTRMATSTFYTVALTLVTAFSFVGSDISGAVFEIRASFWIVLTLTVLIVAFATAGTPETSAVTSTTTMAAMGLPVDLYLIMHCIEPFIGTIRNGVDANGIILTSLFVKWLDEKKPFEKKEEKEVVENA